EPVEKRQALDQNHGFWSNVRPRQRTSSEQTSYSSLPAKAESSSIPLLLLSRPNPLRWALAGFPMRTFGASAVKRHFRGFAPPCLCAFAGTRPAKSTDFILFCCLRNKTPAEGFHNILRHFILGNWLF
ncbi:MAG: hypothetical protein LIO95_07000, partial [Clostridiales bacterium]|nr:hypothetical protein [Clostridiales bacterium]